MNKKPSVEKNDYWIYEHRRKGVYPAHTEYGGKWLLFVNKDEVDVLWEVIKDLTGNGMLGGESKVSTAKVNPNAVDPDKKVICVYTYDYRDKDDVMRIRQVLRSVGIINKIPYKTDQATLNNEYRKGGSKKISVYYE
jgi:hypothetical protein